MMAPAPESPFAGAHAAAGFAWRGGPRLNWESEACKYVQITLLCFWEFLCTYGAQKLINNIKI